MYRPFYVYTPRNIFGESLIHPSNCLKYRIKNSMHISPRPVIKEINGSYREAVIEAKRMNDDFEAELAAIFI